MSFDWWPHFFSRDESHGTLSLDIESPEIPKKMAFHGISWLILTVIGNILGDEDCPSLYDENTSAHKAMKTGAYDQGMVPGRRPSAFFVLRRNRCHSYPDITVMSEFGPSALPILFGAISQGLVFGIVNFFA